MTSATAKPTFSSTESSFKRELFSAVDAHFANGKSRNATPGYYAKAAFWLASTFGLWGVLTFVSMPWWLGIPLALLTGFSMSQVGFNVGHDAIHGSLSKKKWVNELFSRSFEIMGASSKMWAWAHNVVHHTYTNVPGTDHDLEPGFYLHLYRREGRGFMHRFQHVYAWALYTLTMFVWVFKKDWVQLAERGEATTKKDVADVIIGKLVHFSFWLGVPMLFGVNAWWQVLIGYALVLAMCGFTAAVVFQLAHVVEGPSFPHAEEGALEDDFWTHQLKTTANFAPRSALATFLTGGLNHQVEHHLFPRICHAHYGELSKLVEAIAAKHGLPYHSSPTFWGAMASHARTLKAVGTGDEKATTPPGLPAAA